MSAHFSSASEYYDRVYEWVLDAHSIHKAQSDTPFFVCVNGPQGSGKSTLTSELVERGTEMGVSMLAVSIDDFYLIREDQKDLGRESGGNRFLQKRGYPGTHDVELGRQTLLKLKQRKSEVMVPRYDKSAFFGVGDRKPESEWSKVNAEKLQVVFLEGWMLGFLPLTEKGLQMQTTALQLTPADTESFFRVNEELMQYEAWLEQMDAFIRLKISDFSWVVNWRTEAEQNMKATGKQGMSRDEVIAYAVSFLPAYHAYSGGLELFAKRFESSLELKLGQDRLPEVF